jgi:hypothetical protein
LSSAFFSGVFALLLLHTACALSSEPTKIPIEIRDNFPILVATVDGIEVPLKFDLGDSESLVLQQEILDRVKAVPTGETARLRGFYGVFEAPLFSVQQVRIGSLVFTDVVARLDRRDPAYEPGASGEKGYLGTGLLTSHAVVLDYPQRTMILVPRVQEDESNGTCQGKAVPFSSKWHGQLVTEVETDFGPAILWWDTGSPTTFLSKSFARKAQAEDLRDTITTQRLNIGGTNFGPWQFSTWDVSPPGFDGVVGYDFFARHVVCVDFPGNRLLIDAAKASQ